MAYTSESPTIYEAILTLTTAQVKLLNGTPKTIVAAPGAGFAIEALSMVCDMTFVSAAYVTNTALSLAADTATIAQMNDTAILLSTGSRITTGIKLEATGTTAAQVIENKALQLKELSGNPATGDSNVIVTITYKIINV